MSMLRDDVQELQFAVASSARVLAALSGVSAALSSQPAVAPAP